MHIEELRLREACSRGDLKTVNRILNPDGTGCASSPIGRLLLKHMLIKQRAPSLSCSYADDSCNFLVHYLAGANPPAASSFNHWLEKLHRILGRHQSRPSKTDRQRAATIRSLLRGHASLDFSVQNTRGQGVLHFCAETNSVEVLRVILRATANSTLSPDRSPVLDLQDQNDTTPLTVALKRRNFHCVRLLMAADCLQLEHRHQRQNPSPPVSPVTPSGPSKSVTLLHTVSTFTDMFNRKDQKLKELQKELDLSRGRQQEIRISTRSFQNLQEIQEELMTSLEVIKAQQGVDESTAQTLFVNSNFNLEQSLQSGQNLAQENSPVNTTGPCMVCFEDITPRNQCRISLPCGHVTCDSCWKGILQARLDEGDVHKAICPWPECSFQFPLSCLSLILHKSDSARFLKLLMSRFVDMSSQMRWCPREECGSAVLALDPVPPDQVFSASCHCGTIFCFSCSHPSHEPASCSQAEEWRGALDVINTEKQSMNWLKLKTVPCPRCKSPIQRDGGCNQMACSVCRQLFCYQCGQPWSGHTDHFVCNQNPNETSKRLQISNAVWSALEGVFEKMKEVVTMSNYQWHLHQYLAHDFNSFQLKYVAKYIKKLLAATLPDEQLNGVHGIEVKTFNTELETEYVDFLIETVISAQQIFKNSFILAFYLKKASSRRKFLIKLQQQLQPVLDEVTLHIVQFPGFAQMTANHQTQITVSTFTHDDELLRRQFLYVHEMHEKRLEIQSRCQMTCRFRDDVIRAGRLGLIKHTKSHKQFLPTSVLQTVSGTP
eukprot:g6328.t1